MRVRVLVVALAVMAGLFLCACENTEEPPAAPTKKAGPPVMLPATSPLSGMTCKINRATVQKAVHLFLSRNGRLPNDINELVRAKYFDRNLIVCPSGGTFSIVEKGQVECDVHSPQEK